MAELSVGERVLWVRRLGRKYFPRGIGTVRRVVGTSVYVSFDPPIAGPRRGGKVREAHDARHKFLSVPEAGEVFGEDTEDPMVSLFLGKG